MLKHKSHYQTYTDGWGTSWKTEDRRLTEVRQQVIHFRTATVGERRFWDAMAEGTEIDMAVKVPEKSAIERGDVFVIAGKQYEVVQKQYKDDILPASWLLSLQSAPFEYPAADPDPEEEPEPGEDPETGADPEPGVNPEPGTDTEPEEEPEPAADHEQGADAGG